MIALSDSQLRAVLIAASALRVQDRDAFLRLIAEQLKTRDIDVTDAIERIGGFGR